jgi:hypothetical protein
MGVNMAAHRHTADGVYRWLLRHATAGDHRHPQTPPAATILWDFKKAFENVRRDLLLQAAQKFAYPVWWLRLSLASYSWPSVLAVEHAAAHPMLPGIGVAAGAMSATFELHLYLLGMLHAHTQHFPSIGITVHVDRICDFKGKHDDIVEQADASSQLVRQFLQDVGMPLAADKEQVVSTTYWLAQQLSKISRRRQHSSLHRPATGGGLLPFLRAPQTATPRAGAAIQELQAAHGLHQEEIPARQRARRPGFLWWCSSGRHLRHRDSRAHGRATSRAHERGAHGRPYPANGGPN